MSALQTSEAEKELRYALATLDDWTRRALGDRYNDYSKLIIVSNARVERARAAIAKATKSSEADGKGIAP